MTLPNKPSPKRIQRKRTQGWKAPAGAVYVGRPSRWGNPYRLLEKSGKLGREMALRQFRELYIRQKILLDPDFLEPLRGKDLMCWCSLEQAYGANR